MKLTLTDQSYLKQPRLAKFSASKTLTCASLFAAINLNDPLQSAGFYLQAKKKKNIHSVSPYV